MAEKPPPSRHITEAPLTEPEAAKAINFSSATLRAGRLGRGSCATLPFVRIGRSIRYFPRDLVAFLDARRVGGDRG